MVKQNNILHLTDRQKPWAQIRHWFNRINFMLMSLRAGQVVKIIVILIIIILYCLDHYYTCNFDSVSAILTVCLVGNFLNLAADESKG